jgi:hypothetical protein
MRRSVAVAQGVSGLPGLPTPSPAAETAPDAGLVEAAEILGPFEARGCDVWGGAIPTRLITVHGCIDYASDEALASVIAAALNGPSRSSPAAEPAGLTLTRAEHTALLIWSDGREHGCWAEARQRVPNAQSRGSLRRSNGRYKPLTPISDYYESLGDLFSRPLPSRSDRRGAECGIDQISDVGRAARLTAWAGETAAIMRHPLPRRRDGPGCGTGGGAEAILRPNPSSGARPMGRSLQGTP